MKALINTIKKEDESESVNTVKKDDESESINTVKKDDESESDDMRPIISYEQFSITWDPVEEDDYKNLKQFCDKHRFPDTVFLKYDKENIRKLRCQARDLIIFKKIKSVSQWSL